MADATIILFCWCGDVGKGVRFPAFRAGSGTGVSAAGRRSRRPVADLADSRVSSIATAATRTEWEQGYAFRRIDVAHRLLDASGGARPGTRGARLRIDVGARAYAAGNLKILFWLIRGLGWS